MAEPASFASNIANLANIRENQNTLIDCCGILFYYFFTGLSTVNLLIENEDFGPEIPLVSVYKLIEQLLAIQLVKLAY